MPRRLICAVLGDRAGVVAIEFAIALPVLCMMVFAVFETTQAIICYYKVVDAASSIADLIGQTTVAEGGVASGEFDNLYSAAQLIMSPNSGTALELDVASVTYNSSGAGAKVAWQVERGGASSIAKASLTAAASTLGVAKGSVIVVQATYSFTSPLNYFFKTPIAMTFQAFAIPRNMAQIACPPSGSGESCS